MDAATEHGVIVASAPGRNAPPPSTPSDAVVNARTLVACHHAVCRSVGETQEGSEEAASMSSEEEKNMALVRRFWEAVANADLDALDELLAPDFVDHSLLEGQESGREG